jgi:hypothetical protein
MPRLSAIALLAVIIVLTDVTSSDNKSLQISIGLPGRRRLCVLSSSSSGTHSSRLRALPHRTEQPGPSARVSHSPCRGSAAGGRRNTRGYETRVNPQQTQPLPSPSPPARAPATTARESAGPVALRRLTFERQPQLRWPSPRPATVLLRLPSHDSGYQRSARPRSSAARRCRHPRAGSVGSTLTLAAEGRRPRPQTQPVTHLFVASTCL